MDDSRRSILAAGTAFGAALLTGAQFAHAAVAPFELDPIPPLPAKPTPGKPGDFDFLTGEWRIRNRQPKPNTQSKEWIEFNGEATVHGILAGVGSVEELRIPEKKFSGMGLRMLDVEKKVWADHWVNSQSGVVTAPGVSGSFENGAAIFVSEDEDNGKPVKFAGVWDLITPKSCRWRQASSRDGGKTWEQSWIMDWKRV